MAMNIRRMQLADLNPADYNPRKDLQPDDPAYLKIKQSLETFGMVEPIIWNERTGHIVGGHQRIKALRDMGEAETDVVVINEPLKEEKKLNVILNRAKGRWDNEKLAPLMQELSERGDVSLTGFEDYELQGLIDQYQNRLADILDYSPPEPQPDNEQEEETPADATFSMIFSIPAQYKDAVDAYEANEILDFSIGIQPYGEVRWIGQVLGVDGSRRAERLNNNYFINGRHTPLMIMIQGGTLTNESYDKLTKYMDDIKGEAGQHAFIVLETESTDSKTDFDETEKPKIEVKDLASILQKDELFQSYMDNNRKKVQSSFLLPDLYTGYTTDFNRATAQTAQEVTEKQVFQPERKSLAWAINNRLLNAYGFKYVEAYFLEPNISNPDDITKLLTAATAAGGVTPNKAKEILYKYLGEDSDDYDEEWGNVPLSITNSPSSGGFDLGALTMALDGKIQKAASRPEDAQVYAVMKEVRKLLVDLKQQQEGEQ